MFSPVSVLLAEWEENPCRFSHLAGRVFQSEHEIKLQSLDWNGASDKNLGCWKAKFIVVLVIMCLKYHVSSTGRWSRWLSAHHWLSYCVSNYKPTQYSRISGTSSTPVENVWTLVLEVRLVLNSSGQHMPNKTRSELKADLSDHQWTLKTFLWGDQVRLCSSDWGTNHQPSRNQNIIIQTIELQTWTIKLTPILNKYIIIIITFYQLKKNILWKWKRRIDVFCRG